MRINELRQRVLPSIRTAWVELNSRCDPQRRDQHLPVVGLDELVDIASNVTKVNTPLEKIGERDDALWLIRNIAKLNGKTKRLVGAFGSNQTDAQAELLGGCDATASGKTDRTCYEECAH